MSEHYREVIELPEVCRRLNVSRRTIYRLLEDDSRFPEPFRIRHKLQWYADEIADYLSTRPRRQYRVRNTVSA